MLTQNLGFLAAGGPTYSVALSALPNDVVLPPGTQVSYIEATGQLICNGPMLNSTYVSLLSASSSDTAYDSALTALFNQAWKPSGATSPSSSVVEMLIDDETASSTPADRYNYVLAGLLSYLTTTQSQNLVKQTLAQTLAMDPAVVQLLIEGNAALGWPTGLLPSAFALDAVLPIAAVNDFLGGLAAAYTSMTAGGGTNPTVQIDPGVDLKVPANESVLWRGKLLPPKTGAYAFAVKSSDGSLSTTPTLSINFENVALPTPNAAISTVNLTAGQFYDISLTVPAAASSQKVALQWCIAPTPLSTLVTIPLLALMPCDSGGGYPTLADLYRIAVLIDGFLMNATEIAYFSSNPTDFQGTDPTTGATAPFSLKDLVAAANTDPPALFNQWQRLSAIYGLKASLPPANRTLIDVFAAAMKASETKPQGTLSDVVPTIAEAMGWDVANLETLAGPELTSNASQTNVFNFTVAQFRNEIALVQVAAALAMSAKVGVSALQLFGWANLPAAATGVSPYLQPSQDIEQTVKAKHDDAGWLKVGKPLNDKLRESSKDALIAFILYLIPQPGRYTTADDLYGFFLIDVEMCTCMETSRLVQASAAVQLFVQRCLLNLEPEVSPSSFGGDAVAEWRQWRKNYRVWQAAVKVFLYPEDWIAPELRSNKTPFFEHLETKLLQGTVTEANAEAAIMGYLKSLQQVARLEMVGVYTDNDTQITHVIGRTFTTPYVYFYRTLNNKTYVWSAWQQVTADISGDTIIPVIWNRRLFLFWPVYTEVTDPTNSSQNNTGAPSISSTSASGGSPGSTTVGTPPQSQKTLQIQLAWSEYKKDQWTPKQITSDYLVPKPYQTYSSAFDPTTILYTASGAHSDALVVTAYSTSSFAISNSNEVFGLPQFKLTFPGGSAISAGGWSVEGGVSLMFDNLYGGVENTSGSLSQAAYGTFLPQAKAIADDTSYPPAFRAIATELVQIYSTIGSSNANPPSPAAMCSMSKLLDQIWEAGTTKLNKLGKFTFDGPQGSVETDPEHAATASQKSQFSTAASLYVFNANQVESAFVGQDVEQDNSYLSLIVSGAPVALFSAPSTPSAFTLTFPQQMLPSYSIDAAAQSFQKVIFYADRRRTYFVVKSLPSSLFFFNHYHPWVGEFINQLNRRGISSLLNPTTQALNTSLPQSITIRNYNFSFNTSYSPTPSVSEPFPIESVDFGPTSADRLAKSSKQRMSIPAGDFAYSMYNFELFFWIPFLLADRLSQNLQFDEAETFFRYIFNSTNNSDKNGRPPAVGYLSGPPNCYWNILPLNNLPVDTGLANLLLSASGPNPNPLFDAQLAAWQLAPFEPEVIAQFRPVAYQKAVVMKYLDHLIRRGDYCFRQNTRESINKSIQYYILADQILGKKPITIPQPGVVLDQTYAQLVRDPGGIYGLGNANVALENAFPFTVSATVAVPTSLLPSALGGIFGMPIFGPPSTPYFCTPDNPTLLGYYDTIADRLYKIRHCMNIKGQIEQLALFAPPINPGLLVAAEAAGVDLSSVLNDIAAAVPHYRFTTMMAKALELCGEVRSLGAALLSAMEKYDAEGLALLRAGQEVSVQQSVLAIKQLQVQEANDNLAGLQATMAVTVARQQYYETLVQGGWSSYENGQVSDLGTAQVFKDLAQVGQLLASISSSVPQFNIGVAGAMGTPNATVSYGGQQVSSSARAVADGYSLMAETYSFSAATQGLSGSWDRRAKEWGFQFETATLEMVQIQQHVNAGSVRVQFASQDVSNQNLLIAHASAVQSALQSKFTNQELYNWMVGQTAAVFFQCYQMAYDLAKRAEACYRFELGIAQSSYIQFGYWDSMKQGLLAGEKLFKDLKRLEIAYLDQNLREYEISKSISLLLLDPSAFISLKLTGQCIIILPEAFFDLDYPGHYMRRIRNVSLSIPCLTGPYTSVNCTLTLLQSRIRLNSNLNSGASPYVEKPVGSDERFSYGFSSTESIATSTAQNDSGLFEVNFRDERYLPFEGAGVVSQWRLCMPLDCNAFDFETITDLVFNLRYTARNGGDALTKAAKAAAILPAGTALQSLQSIAASQSKPSPSQSNLQRYFSLRHEYPTEWHRFLHPAAGATSPATMQINLGKDRFPFQYRSSTIQITQAQFAIVLRGSSSSSDPSALSGLVLRSGSGSNATSFPSSPQTTIPQTLGVAFLYTIPTPPPRVKVPGVQSGPPCWILQGPTDMTPLTDVVDIMMICTYSTTPGTSA